MKFLLSCSLIIILFTACSTKEPQVNYLAEKAAIRKLLDAQITGWNNGNLQAYMQGYAKTDSLRFASGNNVRYGWQQTLTSYQRGYPDKKAMGLLTFPAIDIRIIGPETALIFGKWHLQRAKDNPHGLFTLIMQKRKAGWRIIHDHTSSAAN